MTELEIKQRKRRFIFFAIFFLLGSLLSWYSGYKVGQMDCHQTSNSFTHVINWIH